MWRKMLSGVMAMVLVATVVGFTSRPVVSGALAPAEPASSSTISIEGSKQGKITKAPVALLSYDYTVMSPRDAGSGMATGKRQHKPITIRKEWDATTPLLFKAMVTNEVLKTVTITRSSPGGTYEAKLINAEIAGITHSSGDSGANAYEEITFTFQRIEMSFSIGKDKTTAMDDWSTQR